MTVEPHVVFGPGVEIADGATIKAFSHIEGATIATKAIIGPFARLRPGAKIGEKAKVGNFVEVKAVLGPGAKANHLSYIGDADVGANANIGAGTITCNYDGLCKYSTVIGAEPSSDRTPRWSRPSQSVMARSSALDRSSRRMSSLTASLWSAMSKKASPGGPGASASGCSRKGGGIACFDIAI